MTRKLTHAGHLAPCDCHDCKEARRAYDRHRYRRIGYGQWAPFTDAAPVRAHVRELMGTGVSVNRIADLAGVSQGAVRRLLYGAPSKGKAPSRRIRPGAAAAILSVTAAGRPLRATDRVDATGTRRRLESLGTLGYSAPALAAQVPLAKEHVRRILRGYPHVTAATAARVRAAYDRLWDQPAPAETRWQKTSVAKTRALAARKGWTVPASWDDEEIDNPRARPRGVRREEAAA